jgi:hypothetical protein
MPAFAGMTGKIYYLARRSRLQSRSAAFSAWSAWAIGTAAPPERFEGAPMRRLQTIDYIKYPE